MRLPSILLAVLLAAGLYYWFAMRGPAEPVVATAAVTVAETAGEARQDQPVPVMVLESTSEQTADMLVLRGRTLAARNVNVPAETAGLVISAPLRKGAEVEEGQLLCEIDAGARAAQLAEAEARLAEARAEANAATTLSAKGFSSETTRIARNAALQAAEAAVDLVNLDIERLKITAPFSGALETDTAELGSRLGLGDTCATIIDLSTVKVEGFISESVVDAVSVGQPATARLVNNREVEGEITFISRVADPETRTYAVEVTLPNEGQRIRDGMTAELLVTLPPQIAHLIPQSALTLNDEGELGVRVLDGAATTFTPVRILQDKIDGVWVSGLPDQARIVVVGQEFVRDGRAVEPTVITWDALR